MTITTSTRTLGGALCAGALGTVWVTSTDPLSRRTPYMARDYRVAFAPFRSCRKSLSSPGGKNRGREVSDIREYPETAGQ